MIEGFERIERRERREEADVGQGVSVGGVSMVRVARGNKPGTCLASDLMFYRICER